MSSPKYHYTIEKLLVENEEKSYMLGFILADGSVRSITEGKKRFEMGLAAEDILQLEKVRNFFCSTHPIKIDKKNIARFTITGRVLFEELGKYNIVPSKTFHETVPDQYSNDRHYWRGVIDGDGFIALHKQRGYPQIGLCGTKEICDQFLNFIHLNGIETEAKPIHRPPKINNHYAITFTSGIAQKIMRLLYDDCTIFLDRKKKIVDEINSFYTPGRKVWRSGYKHKKKWHKRK